MWKLLQGLHKGRSWEWGALVRPAPQVAYLDDDDKKTCVVSELHERLPWKCLRKYYPRFSRWPRTSDEKIPDCPAAVTAETVLNNATTINNDTLASRSTQTYTGHPTAEQATDQVTGIIQVKVNNTRSSIPPSSRDVVAEGTENDQSVTYTDGTEAEDGSKGCFCGDAGTNDGTKRHWKRWQRDFRHDFWAGLREPFGFVEAMGWSTTLILGLNLCYLWQPDSERKTWSQQLYRVAHSMNHDSTLTARRNILDNGQQASGKVETSVPKSCDDKKSSSTPLQSKEVEKDALAEAAEEWLKLTRTYTNMTRNSEATLLAKAGRYRDAFQLWCMAAEAGYDKAHYNVALCYEQGKGTKTDLSKAICHYKMAATAGHSKAKFNLAVLQQQGQGGLQNDPQQVMGLLQEAAEGGLKQAQTQLGVLYTAEDTRDWTKASRWFERAAKQNDSMAQYYLGICYERGWGVERDLAKAAEMYSLASQRGHAGAECSLASLYARGLGGLPRDRKLALQLYESSVQGGNEEAEVEVRRLRQLLDEEAKEAELENEELASSDSTLSANHRCQRLCEQLNNNVQVNVSRQARSTSSPSLSDYIRQHLIEFGFSSEFDSTESYFTVPTTFVTKSRKTDNIKAKTTHGGKTVPCFFIGDGDNRNSDDVEQELCYTHLEGGSFGNIAIATGS